MRAPSAWNFLGFSRNSLISWSSSTASSAPATSLNVTFGESTLMRLARLLPKLITFEPPPCIWFMRKSQNPRNRMNGSTYVRIETHVEPPALSRRCRACPAYSSYTAFQAFSPGMPTVYFAPFSASVPMSCTLHGVAALGVLERLDLARVEVREHRRPVPLLRLGRAAAEHHVLGEERQQNHDDDREGCALEEAIHVVCSKGKHGPTRPRPCRRTLACG